ncbi:hypothetical protein KKA14_14960, partial [bacterium]|nr:hypothetical protein [bacterium]
MKKLSENEDYSKYLDFVENLKKEDLSVIQSLARNQVIEPFEGRKSLKTLRRTLTTVDKGVATLKTAGRKTGKWINETRIAKSSIYQLSKIKNATSISTRVGNTASEIQKIAMETFNQIESKLKESLVSYIEKGFELLLDDDLETLISDKANQILNHTDFKSLEDIKHLSIPDREKLIDALYPYDNEKLNKLGKSLDISINLILGAVVVTNLPGTGLLISLINIGKTIVKMGNRLTIMSAVYGHQIKSSQELFNVCTKIIKSMENWENDPNHLPVNPEILHKLYQEPAEKEENTFLDLITAVTNKDAYIALPGIGMISIGKINLDDLKIDLVIKRVVRDYFENKRLLVKFDEKQLNRIINDFKNVYSELYHNKFFDVLSEKQKKSSISRKKKKLKDRFTFFSGIEP